MARKKEPPKPLFPLKHEFYESLDNFIHVAGMLRNSVSSAIDLSKNMEPAVREILRKDLAAFDAVWSGD